jgi:hypothetical protein
LLPEFDQHPAAEAASGDCIAVLIERVPVSCPRETLDWPLALVSMDWPVMLFVSGAAVLQLPRKEQPAGTTAAGHWRKLWGAAEELGARIYVSVEDWSRYGADAQQLAVAVVLLPQVKLQQLQRHCRHLIHV